MYRLVLSTTLILLSGCAITGGWRALSIDSSSEPAFQDSVTLLNAELPTARREMFAMALIDIARTGLQNAEADSASSAYTDEDFRSELDGLTYDEVIALADRTGVSIARQYVAGVRAGAPSIDSQYYDPTRGRPLFNATGQPLRSYRPGGQNWPTGADARGRAEYMNR